MASSWALFRGEQGAGSRERSRREGQNRRRILACGTGRKATPAVGGNELRACRLTPPCFDSARADRTCACLRRRVRITRLQNPYTRCSETAKGYRLGQSAFSFGYSVLDIRYWIFVVISPLSLHTPPTNSPQPVDANQMCLRPASSGSVPPLPQYSLLNIGYSIFVSQGPKIRTDAESREKASRWFAG